MSLVLAEPNVIYVGAYQPENFNSWLTQALNCLRHELRMETGIASFIDQDNYKVVAVDSVMEGVFMPGAEYELQDTYCHAVCNSKLMVCYERVGTIDGMLQHPVYLAVKLESYIAAPILTPDGRVIGTINFTSLEPHSGEFSEHEQSLVRMLAQEVAKHVSLYEEIVVSL